MHIIHFEQQIAIEAHYDKKINFHRNMKPKLFSLNNFFQLLITMQTMVIISNLTFSLAYPGTPLVWFVNEPKRSHKSNSQICGANKKIYG